MGWATQRGPRHRLVATSHRLASCVIVSRFRTVLDLDTYPLSNFIRPRCTGKLVFSLFSRHISRSQSFQQNRHINFHALVALKMLVSLISRLVVCSLRIVVDKQTDRQTQNDSCNPRCACAPRVNYCEGIVAYICGKVHFGTMLKEGLYNWKMSFLGGSIEGRSTILGRERPEHTDHEIIFPSM